MAKVVSIWGAAARHETAKGLGIIRLMSRLRPGAQSPIGDERAQKPSKDDDSGDGSAASL